MSTVPVVDVIGWWMAVYLIMVGTYLVFFSESNSPFIIFVGALKGTVGAVLYLLLREPMWMHTYVPSLPDILLTIFIGELFFIIILLTLTLWKAHHLQRPTTRMRHTLVEAWLGWKMVARTVYSKYRYEGKNKQ